MSKYIGIKTANIVGQTATPMFDIGGKSGKKPHIFLWQLLFCCLFTAAYILLGFLDIDAIKIILNAIYKAITFDFIGTDTSGCVINEWLSGIL